MKNKATILPGLMLFASSVILMVCGMGFDFVFSRFPSLGIVLIELLAFVPPTYCLYKSQDQNFRLNFRWEKQPDKLPVYFGFTVKFALAVSFLSFLSNLVAYVVCGANDIDISAMITTSGAGNHYGFLSFLGIVVFSPIVEELFVRGALFSSFEYGLFFNKKTPRRLKQGF